MLNLGGLSGPPILRREPSGGVLDHLADRKQRLFVERPADQLQPQRQALTVEPGRKHGGGRNRAQMPDTPKH